MSHYEDLDDIIYSTGMSGSNPMSLFDSSMFLQSIRKLAADPASQPGQPAPDADLASHAAAVQTGAEASPERAEAGYETATPDTTGQLEGEFAVPVEQVVTTMAQLTSHELKLQLAYLFYAEMLRGLNRDMTETFEEIAKDEIKDAKYLLLRISVLQPGGAPIPVPPSPTPMHDPQEILNQMITGEQQAIVLLKALHAQLGENPMKFTVESMMSEEQSHLDRLWQYQPPGVPEKQASAHDDAHRTTKKLRVNPLLGKSISRAHKAVGKFFQDRVEFAKTKKAAVQPIQGVSPGATPIPEAGAEPIEISQLREQNLQLQQNAAEMQDMAARLQQTQQQSAQFQQQAEQAQAQAQQSAQQAEMQGQAAAQAQQQAAVNMETATVAQSQAATEAEAKMRLSMRIQQLRQQMANLASQDPVAEEGMAAGGQAGPTGPATPQQQQGQLAEQQTAEQQQAAAAEQEQAAATGGPKAKKEVQQAQKATQTAGVQQQQAQKAEQGM